MGFFQFMDERGSQMGQDTFSGPGISAYLRGGNPFDDISRLPEEIQEQINAHAEEFRTEQDIRQFVQNLAMRA